MLIVTQLVKQPVYGTRRFITVLTEASQWTIMSQLNPIRFIDSYLPKVCRVVQIT
jgi:hypothetical protein